MVEHYLDARLAGERLVELGDDEEDGADGIGEGQAVGTRADRRLQVQLQRGEVVLEMRRRVRDHLDEEHVDAVQPQTNPLLAHVEGVIVHVHEVDGSTKSVVLNGSVLFGRDVEGVGLAVTWDCLERLQHTDQSVLGKDGTEVAVNAATQRRAITHRRR